MSDAELDDRYRRYRHLQLSLRAGVMTVTLSNPGKKNACTPGMADELSWIWDDLATDHEVRVIVLTGAGSDFCAGVDLASKTQTASEEAVRLTHPTTRRARQHVMKVLECEKPTIAKVRGAAYGMGASLALACDMVFAAEGAKLCDSHVKAGMAAGDGGVLLWPLAIGFHRAKQHLMLGEPVTAEEADRIGLINRCVPDAQLDSHVDAIASRLQQLPPHAVNYTKVALNVALKHMTASAFETSLAYEIYTMGMDDCKEAIDSFLQKRPPRYSGR